MKNIYEEAIEYYKHGISHDIFKPPVMEYASLAIDALEKQDAKKPELSKVGFICPYCKYFQGSYADYCCECGQKLDWSDSE